ncbi:ABC transporter ATP-binding protein [Oceanobacillus indicireducens]|uniref:ABC transporter ATP-binding protein YhcH n=1 Tax=Oceanobacillus indicireducens TaxID=1004261 RepID=A0A917Y3R9_9BACI|nr:ABC transporter ATP-binding protein [Oceanobacillus indicireducens]GGN66070.1 putative ABC transporter ATP-binding protein YhcH [Oceanobacillus indicireducens]
MTEIAMQLTNVRKRIGNKEIIKGLSFTINRGEVFGFIGPNGAGKTTTIRMMVGLMKLTEGDVHILGKSIKTEFKEAIREVGGIVENPELYPFLTGAQNLKQYARMIPGITQERIDETVKLVGLEKVMNEKVGRYSLGMRQRIGIAQALLHKPSVLILDEPTNGLDPAGIREIRQYIRKLATEHNVAVIISSHLLSEIELICDRIGIIKNGELVAIQAVKENTPAGEQQLLQVEMEATPLEKALEVVNRKTPAAQTNGKITFQTEKENIPLLISDLVKENILIYEVQVTKSTLEDKFFDLIGENIID